MREDGSAMLGDFVPFSASASQVLRERVDFARDRCLEQRPLGVKRRVPIPSMQTAVVKVASPRRLRICGFFTELSRSRPTTAPHDLLCCAGGMCRGRNVRKRQG